MNRNDSWGNETACGTLARGQTEFQVNLKLGLTPMTRGFIVCGDGTREQIDNSEELRAWVLDLAGRIRAARARARVREVIPVIPRLGQCRPRGMRGYCGQARISDDGQAGASEPMKESNSYRTVPRQSSGRGLHQPTGGTGRLVRIPNTSARVGHIDRSVERRGGIESAPVISVLSLPGQKAHILTNTHHRALVCPFAIPRLSSLERDATSRARSLRFQTK